MRIQGSPSSRHAGHSSPVASPAANRLKDQIDVLRQRYWFFMSQKPPRVKAANLCLVALRPLMKRQLEREMRAEKSRA